MGCIQEAMIILAQPSSRRIPRHGSSATGRTRTGFTMVELVFVLAIGLITAGIAAPKYFNATNRYRVSVAAHRIAADFTLARAQARSRSTTQTIVFTQASNSYTLSGVKNLDGNGTNYTVNLAAEPYNVTLTSVDFGNGATQTSFDRFGFATAGGTVTISANGWTKTIVLDKNTGLASVQ
jgi:prepilin-type N-terminal cleavage/methylation domain-containing protein